MAGRRIVRLGAWCHVLHVQQPDAFGGLSDRADGVPTADGGPVDVQLELDLGRELCQEDVPDRRAVERLEFERVVVIAEPHSALRECRGESAELGRESAHVVDGAAVLLRHPGNDHPRTSDLCEPVRHGGDIVAQPLDALMCGHDPKARLLKQPCQLAGRGIGQPRQLNRPIAGGRDRLQGSGQVVRRKPAYGVELKRDPVVSHGATIGHRTGVASPTVTPLGLGIVGTGNIAGAYARDILTHPQIRLAAATDLDAGKAAAFGAEHGCAVHESLDELLTDPTVDIVVNLTVHQAHYDVTKRALEAGRHVYSEKPMALRSSEGQELVALAASRGLRLGCSPSTFLGEAQQTAAALIRDGRLGPVRAVYAEVNWGRIETWHPAPAAFFDVGVMFDVGVYPLTLVTSMLGPARSVRAWGWDLKPERTTLDGTPFRIGSPDLIVAAVELDGGAVLRLTCSFYVGRPAKATGSIEFHGDDASLALGSFQEFDATVEVGPYGESYEPVAPVRQPFRGTAWARGVADMADAIAEGRPHRASAEQAAHVVEILEAASTSIADGGRRVDTTTSFSPPPLMPWAKGVIER
jgi:predicted dehydrogenase